jgi:hypothetical protein
MPYHLVKLKYTETGKMPDEVEKRIKKAADWKVCRENYRLPMFTRLPVVKYFI